jgi:hypothetical protein
MDIAVTAEQEFPDCGGTSFVITKTSGGYHLRNHTIEKLLSPNSEQALLHVLQLSITTFVEQFPEYLPLHSGCAEYNGRRFIYTGKSRAGKTTLSCRMLFEGLRVFSDDIVLLGDDLNVAPYPKPLNVKEGTQDVIPELRDICNRLSPYTSILDKKILRYFVDPYLYQTDKSLSAGKLSAIFLLDPVHSGESAVEPIPTWQMAHEMLTRYLVCSTVAGDQIQRLNRLVNSCNCYRLRVGDPDSTVRVIQDVLA